VFVLVLSVTTTAYVAAVYVPGELWIPRGTPVLLGGGFVAVTTKSWLALKTYVASGRHEVNPASAVVPKKRILTFAVYGRLLWIASKWTLATLSQKSLETARAGMTVSASVVIVSRLAYTRYASRPRPDDGWMADVSESGDRAASRGQSEPATKRDMFFPSLPSVPDSEPRETMAAVRASILAEGVGNAMTTGGVVDNRFGHWRHSRSGLG
jgi:hypothetical protein